VTEAPDDHPPETPGSYSRYRQLIDDPTTRDALLLQVRSTVGGLRGAYRLHVLVAVLALVAIAYTHPVGLLGRLRWVLVGAAVLMDVVAFLGLRTVTHAPARWLFPLLTIDVIVAAGMPVLTAVDGRFNLAWMLLLGLPVMLLLYVRDARTITPLLSEHRAYRRAQERRSPDA
jgi:hypothetical protein